MVGILPILAGGEGQREGVCTVIEAWQGLLSSSYFYIAIDFIQIARGAYRDSTLAYPCLLSIASNRKLNEKRLHHLKTWTCMYGGLYKGLYKARHTAK